MNKQFLSRCLRSGQSLSWSCPWSIERKSLIVDFFDEKILSNITENFEWKIQHWQSCIVFWGRLIGLSEYQLEDAFCTRDLWNWTTDPRVRCSSRRSKCDKDQNFEVAQIPGRNKRDEYKWNSHEKEINHCLISWQMKIVAFLKCDMCSNVSSLSELKLCNI